MPTSKATIERAARSMGMRRLPQGFADAGWTRICVDLTPLQIQMMNRLLAVRAETARQFGYDAPEPRDVFHELLWAAHREMDEEVHDAMLEEHEMVPRG